LYLRFSDIFDSFLFSSLRFGRLQPNCSARGWFLRARDRSLIHTQE
jgi:hypothetical protein